MCLQIQVFGNWSYGTIVFTVLVFTVTLKVIYSPLVCLSFKSVSLDLFHKTDVFWCYYYYLFYI